MAMASNREDVFKVCGLCSQLVVESVELTTSMKAFLCRFLDLQPLQLPARVCLECYQHATDASRYKDRCDKAILKLNKSPVYGSMVLGGPIQTTSAATQTTYWQERQLQNEERKINIVVRYTNDPPPEDTRTKVKAMSAPPRVSLQQTHLRVVSGTSDPTQSGTPIPGPASAIKRTASGPAEPGRCQGMTTKIPAKVIIPLGEKTKADEELKRWGPPDPLTGKRAFTAQSSYESGGDALTPADKRRKVASVDQEKPKSLRRSCRRMKLPLKYRKC